MRFPHFISSNTRVEYEPHPASKSLVGELERTIFPEDFEWDAQLCPSLAALCVQTIAKNFKDRPILDELPCADRHYLLEILPVDIPLEIVVPLIEEEIYWKRRYAETHGVVKEVKHKGWNWKCLYMERHLRDVVEHLEPQYNDEEQIDEMLKLVNPYIHKLSVTQLQAWKPPLTMEKDEIPTKYPEDHINFGPIFMRLEFVTEVDICFGMRSVEMDFSWQLFKVSVVDCSRLGKALLSLQSLKIFRLHRTAIDCEKVHALALNLIKLEYISTIDLSHCIIGDTGALCLAKIMLTSNTLKKLRLPNNRIEKTGAIGIGFALLQPNCCPLRVLDLRLNPLKHEGVLGILRAMVRGGQLEELNLAGTLFEDDTGLRVANMVKLNKTLISLDVSSNWFDDNASQELLKSVTENRVIQWLDVRATDIPQEIADKIKKLTYRNRHGLEEVEEDEEPSAEVEIEETPAQEQTEEKPKTDKEDEED